MYFQLLIYLLYLYIQLNTSVDCSNINSTTTYNCTPKISIINCNEHVVRYTNLNYTYNSNVTPCFEDSILFYKWKLKRNKDKTLKLITHFNSNIINIPAFSLRSGNYSLTLHIVEYNFDVNIISKISKSKCNLLYKESNFIQQPFRRLIDTENIDYIDKFSGLPGNLNCLIKHLQQFTSQYDGCFIRHRHDIGMDSLILNNVYFELECLKQENTTSFYSIFHPSKQNSSYFGWYYKGTSLPHSNEIQSKINLKMSNNYFITVMISEIKNDKFKISHLNISVLTTKVHKFTNSEVYIKSIKCLKDDQNIIEDIQFENIEVDTMNKSNPFLTYLLSNHDNKKDVWNALNILDEKFNNRGNILRSKRENNDYEESEETTTVKSESDKLEILAYHDFVNNISKVHSSMAVNDVKKIGSGVISKIDCTNIASHQFSHENITLQLTNATSAKCNSLSVSIIAVPHQVIEDDFLINDDVTTNVYDIAVLRSTTRNNQEVLELIQNDPLIIKYNRAIFPEFAIVDGKVDMPFDRRKWTDDLITKQMTVHRLNMFCGQNLIIRFNLSETDKINVAITKGVRPTLSSFKNRYKVDGSNESSLRISPYLEPVKENMWIYVAVLPNKEILTSKTGNITINYTAEFSSRICTTFDEDNSYKWHSEDCLVEDADVGYLTCKCRETSTSFFAAEMATIESRLDKVEHMDFTLEIVTSNLIFYFVATVFGFYCIMICFSIARTDEATGQENLFFLADNLKNDRYAYLLNIKTGAVHGAGTTSNIVVQLFGKLDKSRAHVLNYPDPEKRLLQLDTSQYFVLTTSAYLGELIEIRFWFDSIGYRPSWFLKKLSIFDLQTYKKCEMTVLQWLDVIYDNCVISVKPSNKVDEENRKKVWRNIRFHFNAENLWNVFNKSHDVKFTYFQRVNVMLSHVLSVYAITLISFGTPAMKMQDAFYYGYIQKYLYILRVGILSGTYGFILNTLICFIFRYCSPKNDPKNIVNKEIFLPHWTIYIAWALLIVIINASMIYLLIFGFWISHIEAKMWIISTSIGMSFNFFIWESVYMSILNSVFEILSRKHKMYNKIYNFELIFKAIEKQRVLLYSKFGEYFLRPYLLHLYKEIPEPIRREKKIMDKTKLEIAELFKDMLLFVFYAIFIYLYVFQRRDMFVNLGNKRMTLMIKNGINDSVKNLNEIKSYNEITQYIDYSLIPGLHSSKWYGDWNVESDGLMSDHKTKLLGVPQLRQFRTNEPNCDTPIQMRFLNMTCLKPSTISTAHYHSNRKLWHHGRMWELEKPEDSYLPAVRGRLMTYPKGGFVTALGRNEKQSREIMKTIKKSKWIDIQTKAIILDFWSYNANKNIFSIVQIIIERASTGIILTSYDVMTGHFIFVTTYGYVLSVFYMTTLIILLIVMLLTVIKEFVLIKSEFFKNPWNYVDCTLIVITTVIITLVQVLDNRTKHIMNELHHSENHEFVLYYPIVQLLKVKLNISAMIVCLATIRLWKSLRFGIIFQVMENTIALGAKALLLIFFYIFYIVFSFSTLSYFLFSSYHPEVNFIKDIFMLMIFQSLGYKQMDPYPDIMLTEHNGIGRYIIVIYLLCSLTLYTFITTIIILHYEESRSHFSKKNQRYTVSMYIHDEYNYLKALLHIRHAKLRLRGGEDSALMVNLNREKVYAKSDEQRYAQSMVLSENQITNMSFVARHTLAKRDMVDEDNVEFLSDESLQVMREIVAALAKPTNNDNTVVFFPKKVNNKLKLICDERLIKMEFIAQKIVTPPIQEEYVDLEDDEVMVTEQCHPNSPEIITSYGDAQRLQNIERRLDIMLDIVNNIKFIAE